MRNRNHGSPVQSSPLKFKKCLFFVSFYLFLAIPDDIPALSLPPDTGAG